MPKTININNLIQEQPDIQEIITNLAPALNNLEVKTQEWDAENLLFSSIKIDDINKLPLLTAEDLWPAQYDRNYGKLNMPYHPLAYMKESYQDILAANFSESTHPLIISAYKITMTFKTRLINDEPIINELFSNNTSENNYLNSLTTTIANHYYPLNAELKGWSYPVHSNTEDSNFNVAIYPDTVKKNLNFIGAVVVSKFNQYKYRTTEKITIRTHNY